MALIIGIDPGLGNTGWGIIESDNSNLRYIASGTVSTSAKFPLAERLRSIFNGLNEVIKKFHPSVCAVEDSFVNINPASSLKLGQARGAAILSASCLGLSVFEYAPRLIKKALVGTGKAEKTQVAAMVKYLLPRAIIANDHESDAIAVSICHAHTDATLHNRNF